VPANPSQLIPTPHILKNPAQTPKTAKKDLKIRVKIVSSDILIIGNVMTEENEYYDIAHTAPLMDNDTLSECSSALELDEDVSLKANLQGYSEDQCFFSFLICQGIFLVNHLQIYRAYLRK
jgi:hypothetical protein